MFLFADFQSFVGQGVLFFVIACAVFVHFAKKLVGGNDEIKSAAKELATKKAVSFLERFFK